jgi:hypothetical protein
MARKGFQLAEFEIIVVLASGGVGEVVKGLADLRKLLLYGWVRVVPGMVFQR